LNSHYLLEAYNEASELSNPEEFDAMVLAFLDELLRRATEHFNHLAQFPQIFLALGSMHLFEPVARLLLARSPDNEGDHCTIYL
jgi:hypothetical protein